MTEEQIRGLEPALVQYLGEFEGCFEAPDVRAHLGEYVRGQLSDLPRKSVEPMAHLAGVPPRTLQEFLSLSRWDEGGMREVVQRLVARDHADAEGIAVVDESGHPKKGKQTACVQRQYCGNSGKVDNCVVSVHLAYASYDTRFRCMLDAEPFLPEGWDRDKKRRESAQVPKAVRYRPKYDIALEQLDRARANGVRFGWVTADEWYGSKPRFVAGLEGRGERFVLEVPVDLMGWLHEPGSAAAAGRGEVQNLCRWSTPMLQQPWVKFHVKDTGKGAVVWEARAAPFWMRRGKGSKAEVVGPYWLVATRDVLDRDVVKYFLSNAKLGTPLEVLLHVAFARWPVERCLEDQKSELGMSHFECRKYGALQRHLLVTLVTYLFLARQCQLLRGETGEVGEKRHGACDGPGDRVAGAGTDWSDRSGWSGGEPAEPAEPAEPGGDGLPSAGRARSAAGRAAAEQGGPAPAPGEGGPPPPAGAGKQCRRQGLARQGQGSHVGRQRHRHQTPTLLHPSVIGVAL